MPLWRELDGGSWCVVRMHAYQIFRCDGPIFVDCWRCNACEAITWVSNGREEVEDLFVIHNIEDDLIDIM